ncbi:cytochrome c [Rhizobiaceae bacterium BDR2-2]|uniref:Cytochrome c n=1 Tax=Ectorhizobium quercum TaxID=2965071 RepID=A0AAE3SVM5_9HYPH|nr:cytochrome c [Ectorhizobium quercum]MCX8998510.1 cytochrome c [Ectorhizobium quercum]
MTMKPAFAVILAAALCSTAALAAEPQEIRQQQMKETGAAFGALNAIARGQRPFDEATVKASLDKLAEISKDFRNHFPRGSETGFESEAGIRIWQDEAGFAAANDKFAADVEAVLAHAPADQDGVRAAVGTIGANCGACHESFRVRR